MTVDIKHFYLNTLLKRFEYLKLKLTDLPDDVITYYDFHEKGPPNGFIYIEVRKGMYGLAQAVFLAQELFKERLNEKRFKQYKFTPGLQIHASKPI